MSKIRVLCFMAVCAVSFCIIVGACKRGQPSEGAQREKTVETVDLSHTLVTRIPGDSFAFMKWDGAADAYSKLMASPWGKASYSMLTPKDGSGHGQVSSLLKAIGLDPDDSNVWRQLLSEAAVFAVYPEPESKEAALGVVFRARDLKLAEKVTALKAELLKSGETAGDLAAEDGTGISFSLKDSSGQQNSTYYLAYEGDIGVLSSNKAVLTSVLKSKGESLPGVAQSEGFKQGVVGLSAAQSRFGIGCIDIQQLLQHSGRNIPADMEKERAALKALVFAFSMEEAPLTVGRLVYDPTGLTPDSWLNTINASKADTLLAETPDKPLFFLSLDGLAVKRVKDAIGKELAEAKPPALQQLSALDAVSRIALIAAVAPLGQSMLPLPDVMLVMDTNNPESTRQGIEELVKGSLANSPSTAAMRWSEKDIDGKNKMKAIVSPIGVGAFLAVKGNLVFLTSTENQMRDVFTGKWKEGIPKALTGQAKAVLVDNPSVANWYLDFQELAHMLDNAKGVLSMFAPQQQDAGSLLGPENLDFLAKKGKMVGSLSSRDRIIELRATYQVPALPQK
jgi:hypothetical protein